jgi:hypothetical protein
MKDSDKILTPDEVASLMPPSISRSWIEAHWKDLGGTNVAGRKLVLWSALHSNLQSEQNRVCQRETIDFSEISDPNCKRENHISQRINPNQNKSIPKIIFFRDGDFFRIGEGKKALSLKVTKGLLFIQFLLRHPQQHFRPTGVYHLGKVQEINNGMMIQDQLFKDRAPHILRLNKKDRALYKKQIAELKAELESNYIDNPQDKLEKKEEIKMIEDELKNNEIRDSGSQKEKARINVQKAISRALSNIHKMDSSIKIYLNSSTIKTGDWCSYEPLPIDPVDWILFRE